MINFYFSTNVKLAIKQRLTDIFDNDLSAADIERKYGISSPKINNWKNTDKNAQASIELTAIILKELPQLNPYWLLLGKGNKWLEETEQVVDKQTEREEGDMSIESQINSLLMNTKKQGISPDLRQLLKELIKELLEEVLAEKNKSKKLPEESQE